MLTRKNFLLVFLITSLGWSADAVADNKTAWKTSTFVIEATAVSGGIQYHRRVLSSLRIGLGTAAGPIQGVKVNRTASRTFDDVREIANAGFLITYRFHENFAVEVSPLRLSLYSGDDWRQFYPSGHLKAFLVFPDVSAPRLGFCTQLTLIRVAGLNGRGDYPLYWLPVLVSLHF